MTVQFSFGEVQCLRRGIFNIDPDTAVGGPLSMAHHFVVATSVEDAFPMGAFDLHPSGKTTGERIDCAFPKKSKNNSCTNLGF